MKTHQNFGACLLAIVLACGGSLEAARITPSQDNTRVNKQGGTTADQQSQTKADLALAQRIRQAVVKDKTLSTEAHNCKIITRDGAVTLKGPVKTTKEKDTIKDIALKIAGDGNVVDELTVKGAK